MKTIYLNGREYKLKRYLSKEEITGLWLREATRRQYRNPNNPESIERYADELKIEVLDTIHKCTSLTYREMNSLSGDELIDLSEKIVLESEIVGGMLYQ